MGLDLDSFESHKGKPLFVHTGGVRRRTKDRTVLRIADIAAQFHDVGKVNPNFQAKLHDNLTDRTAYSSHAYLSALAFLCFPPKGSVLGIKTVEEKISIVAIIAKHHGNLPNIYLPEAGGLSLRGILGEAELDKMRAFLNLHPDLAMAAFTTELLRRDGLEAPPFSVRLKEKISDHIGTVPLVESASALDFFLNTQFAFACLIESDKRDASCNEIERRRTNTADLSLSLRNGLEKTNKGDTADTPLNETRTSIREEAVQTLETLLMTTDQRVFSLTSPTGSGKTRILLSLADVILQLREKGEPLRGVIYTLPFLSITEQVEGVCRSMLGESGKQHLLRFDSRAENLRLQELQTALDEEPGKLRELLQEEFADEVFDSPMVVTTFVQLFETLMSNRNATLLKLPNFASSVILIDEIQALPPRLYLFFTAYLQRFCQKFDAYVILSTATMPYLEMPLKEHGTERYWASKLFPKYQRPPELVSEGHFSADVFSRYEIQGLPETSSLQALAAHLEDHPKSSLIILNTINDTRELYDLLHSEDSDARILLLNTNFTPLDRRRKIEESKQLLDKKEKVFLITTQLVEAGVDIDFPVVYRDLCPLPSLIQAAGRCNRNNRIERGTVYLFELKGKGNKARADFVYLDGNRNPRWFLDFTRDFAQHLPCSEENMLEVQRDYFVKVGNNLEIGFHPGLREGVDREQQSNLIYCIRESAFEDVGKFKLIREQGEVHRLYIPESDTDDAFKILSNLADEVAAAKLNRLPFDQRRAVEAKLKAHLGKMGDRVAQVRLSEKNKGELHRLAPDPKEPLLGLHLLGRRNNYTYEYGLKVSDDSIFF